jgi:hypothetical protein
MCWLPYVIFREAYLMSVRDLAKFKVERGDWGWSHCHPAGAQVIPNIPGC